MQNLESTYHGKKILITGGLGFLGSNLANRLVELGSKVTLLDSFLPLHGANLFNVRKIARKVRMVKGDIRNASLMKRLVKGQDIIFNIAAQTSHTDSIERPFLDVDINARGQINLLESCRKFAPETRVVYCSSRAVYGSAPVRRVSEKCPPNPMDIYAVNKLAGEHYHQIYSRVHNLKTVVLRVSNGYGPRAQMKQPSFGILNWFIRLAVDDSDIKIFGDGNQVRDYLHVDDISSAFLIAGARVFAGCPVYNVGTGRGIRLIEIVKKIVRIAGKGRIVHVPWPAKNKKIDVGDFIADVTKIKRDLDWTDSVPLDQGLQKTITYYQKHKSHYW